MSCASTVRGHGHWPSAAMLRWSMSTTTAGRLDGARRRALRRVEPLELLARADGGCAQAAA
jgi:hypothetical protein